MIKKLTVYLLSFFFFLIIFPACLMGVGLMLDKICNIPIIVYHPYSLILALAFLAFGFFWMIWSVWSIVFVGKGNPQEGFGLEFLPATKELVISGPYCYTRNPMGFGCLTYIAGIGIYFGSIATLFIVMPISIFLVIIYLKYFEEKKLIERFGEEYLKYRKTVPILIPTIYSTENK